jgi:chromate transporter
MNPINPFLLYLVLLKATATTFSGMASLPIIRDELVVERRVLTDEQLNTAIVVGRTTPGPVGLYVVCVGYYTAGVPGALAGWLAMITPAFLVIPLMYYLGRSTEHPRVKGALQAIVLSSAGLMWASAVPLARDAVSGVVTGVILAAGLLAMVLTEVDSVWVILGAALVNLAAVSAGSVAALPPR